MPGNLVFFFGLPFVPALKVQLQVERLCPFHRVCISIPASAQATEFRLQLPCRLSGVC